MNNQWIKQLQQGARYSKDSNKVTRTRAKSEMETNTRLPAFSGALTSIVTYFIKKSIVSLSAGFFFLWK